MIKRLFTVIAGKVDRRAFIFSTLFTVFLFFFERAAFTLNYRSFLLEFLSISVGAYLYCLFLTALAWFCFFLFIYFSFTSSWRHKIFYFLIFVFAVIHEYSYQNVFGRFSTFKDIQVAFATTPEQKFYSAVAYFNFFVLIPCTGYLITLLTIKAKTVTRQFLPLLSILLLLTVLTPIAYWQRVTSFFSFPTSSLGAFARTGFIYSYFRFTEFRKVKRETVEQPLLSDSHYPLNNIVFIVDESIRGDHFSLNGYARKTTPFLDELSQKGWLKNWGISVSASTCSMQTHDILLTGLRPEDFPDPDKKIERVPLIFQYAKAMRYKTYYFDGQMDSYWGALEYDGDSLVDVRKDILTFSKDYTVPYSDTDFELAKKVNEIITSSSGNFIFVFKKGVHLPYNKAFPFESEIWKPSYEGNNPYKLPPGEYDSLVNSYDNGIRYNSDNFFKNLASDYGNLPNNTVILYTGDHGQTLGEGGENYPHCGYSKSEASVPLFILGNLGKAVDTNFKASHANIFATILDLMNYPQNLRKPQYAISLLEATEADSKERYYFPANPALPLTESKMVKFD